MSDDERGADEGGTILLVEDDPAVRGLAVRSLERAGYRVRATDWPEEAIRIAAGPERIAALVTDYMLPQMSGIALATEIRRWRPLLPVLFMSGYPVDVIAGVADFIPKPFGPAALVAAVESVMKRAPLE